MKWVLFILTTILCLNYVGCTKKPSLVLTNNVGYDVQVDSEGTMIRIGKGEAAEVPWPGNAGKFSIKIENLTFVYNTTAVPNGMQIQNKIYMQIEPNRAVYLLSAKTNVVRAKLPIQPNGFPWKPQ
jgi:hypothetical protein